MIINIYHRFLTLISVVAVTLGATVVTAIDWTSFDFSAEYDEPPIAVITVQPEFPENTPVNGGSELLLAILVDVEGKVGDAVILEEDIAPVIAEAVIEAVLQNRYEPAKFHGKPVEVWYMISVSVTPRDRKTDSSYDPSSLAPKGLERK